MKVKVIFVYIENYRVIQERRLKMRSRGYPLT